MNQPIIVHVIVIFNMICLLLFMVISPEMRLAYLISLILSFNICLSVLSNKISINQSHMRAVRIVPVFVIDILFLFELESVTC